MSLSSLLELANFVSLVTWSNSHRIRCLIYPRIYPVPFILVNNNTSNTSNTGSQPLSLATGDEREEGSVFPRVLRLSGKKIRASMQDAGKDGTMYISSGVFLVEGIAGLYLGRVSGCPSTLPEGLSSQDVSLNMKMAVQLAQYVRRSRGTHLPLWPIRATQQQQQQQQAGSVFSEWGQIPGKYLIEDGLVAGGEGSAMDEWTARLNDEIAKY